MHVCGIRHRFELIAPEGYSTIGGLLAVLLVLGGLIVWLSNVMLWPVVVLFGTLWLFVVSFFRDPKRRPPTNVPVGTVVAPADGKVIEIVDEDDELFLHGPARRISIFLSPLNVHVNRAPVAGVVQSARYVPGEYLVAWHPKSSERTERSEIGVLHPSGARVLFKQIAGAVARRIVFHIDEGDTVSLGERFGIVKFGSRMDVLLPPGSEFVVAAGDRVVAGESIIAQLPAGRTE